MKFIDNEHKEFYNEKLKLLNKDDVFYRSLIYCLGISGVTRKHFKDIYNIEEKEININCINEGWQTNSSKKVTRIAFNLFNGCSYDSENDIDSEKLSSYYNISEIFNCNFAPYFIEAIKLRYPEFIREQDNVKVAMYARVGNIEQLKYHFKEEIEDYNEKFVAIYIRSGNLDGDEVNRDIYKQEALLKEYCNKNELKNKTYYIDVRKSGIDKERIALDELKTDILKGKVDKILVTSPNKLFRETTEMLEFLNLCNEKNIDVISLNQGIINDKKNEIALMRYLQEELKDEWDGEYEEDYEYESDCEEDEDMEM